MATTLLATGTTTASSADFTVPAGGSVMLLLTTTATGDIPAGGVIVIESKVGSLYHPVHTLKPGMGGQIIDGDSAAITTWRVTRNPQGASVGSVGVVQA